jgi:hypothetical protein
MYMGIIASRLKDYDENVNHLHLHESTENKFLDTIVDQLLAETYIDYEKEKVTPPSLLHPHGSPQDGAFSFKYLPHLFSILPYPISFGTHCREIYGLTAKETQYVWNTYKSIMEDEINSSNDRKDTLDEGETRERKIVVNFKFLNKIVEQLLEETHIYKVPGNYEYEIEGLRAQPPFLDFDDSDGVWIEDHSIDLEVLIDSDSNSANFIDFTSYCFDMYGLTEDESRYVWYEYRTALWGMDRGSLLGESKENLNSYIHKVVNRMVKDTTIKHTSTIKFSNPLQNQLLNVVLPFDIIDIGGKRRREISPHYIAHPTARLLAELRKHLILIYGMDKWEADQTRVLYLSKILEKINEYKSKRLDESVDLSYSDDRQIIPKQQKFFDHILKTLVDETQVQTMKDWLPDDETYEQRVWVTPPFLNHRLDLPGERDESVEWNEFSYFGYGYASYMKDIYGLTDQEGLKLWAVYYKALEKKVDELIERDRIIYGDD